MSNLTDDDEISLLQLALGLVTALLGTLVKFIMPENGKRIMFASSLYAHLKGIEPESITKNASDELSQEINDALNLVKDNTSAIKGPVLVHSFIWGDVEIDPRCDDCERGVEHILSITPDWLVYDKEKMRKDAAKILHHLHKLVKTDTSGQIAGHA